MPTKEKCFIIMPITTPEFFIPIYRDGKEHFRHVLDCLFIPAVEKAGFIPEPPIAKGSDLIHAEIIKILEKAEIVLCDMSTLNPNVFFEFGIRTSLNKPVCVIKDELTKQVPFDTAILNYQEYDSSLDPWKLNGEIDKIANHLKTSTERSKGENTLWKYFGIRAEAAPLKDETDTDSKLDFLSNQIQSLREKLERAGDREAFHLHYELSSSDIERKIRSYIEEYLRKDIEARMFEILNIEASKNRVQVYYLGKISESKIYTLSNVLTKLYEIPCSFVKIDLIKNTKP